MAWTKRENGGAHITLCLSFALTLFDAAAAAAASAALAADVNIKHDNFRLLLC